MGLRFAECSISFPQQIGLAFKLATGNSAAKFVLKTIYTGAIQQFALRRSFSKHFDCLGMLTEQRFLFGLERYSTFS